MGSGGTEVGSEVAKRLGIDFVDRAILAEAAKKLGTTVAVVADRTEKPPSLGDRVAGFARTVLERSALAGGGARIPRIPRRFHHGNGGDGKHGRTPSCNG